MSWDISEILDTQAFARNTEATPSVLHYKDALKKANAHFDQRFQQGESIRAIVHQRSDFHDWLLKSAWYEFNPQSSNLSLVAVGGYGRGELHPKSDIDILVLSQESLTPEEEERVRDFVTFLWDLGLKVGHAVRTLVQATELAREDVTVMTNLLESRTLAGNPELIDTLRGMTSKSQMWSSVDFYHAKINEQLDRHERNHNTEYNLEPNVKTAPGGLRDIQTISWVAKRHFGSGSLSSLHARGFLTDTEYSLLKNGEAFLWRVRYGIHMLSNRAEERFLVDTQVEVAKILGYKDTDSALAVEQLMRRYYRWVLMLSQLNEVLLEVLKESILGKTNDQDTIKINRRFSRTGHYITTNHSQVFSQSPSAMLEVFELIGADPKITHLSAATIRQLRAHLHLIDDRFRKDYRNITLFMELMRSPYDLSDILRKMTRYGVLGAYLPEFDGITGMMQHDLFHRYTVDAHTLTMIKFLRRFYKGKDADKFPLATFIAQRLPKPELLFIAGLYHDIAKGRGGNHATIGAIDARAFCERHQLGSWDTELVVWLVEKHLLMSGVSQKQDLSDPEVINRFAAKVGDKTYLDYLLCLTVADINATNPELWNSWKALLLRQLYHATADVLKLDGNSATAGMWIEDTKRQARSALEKLGYLATTIDPIWSIFDDDYFLHTKWNDVVWQTEGLIKHNHEGPLVMIRDHADSQAVSATQVFVCAKDLPHTFETITQTLHHANLSIYDARIQLLNNGYAADTLMVLDREKRTIAHNKEFVKALAGTLSKNLLDGQSDNRVSLPRETRLQKHFSQDTNVTFGQDIKRRFTTLEVVANDRPGFLANIAGVLSEHNISLAFARITTLAERVEDTFHIVGSDGLPINDEDTLKAIEEAIVSIE